VVIVVFCNVKTRKIIYNFNRERFHLAGQFKNYSSSVLLLWFCNSILLQPTCCWHLNKLYGLAMFQAVSRLSLTTKFRLLSQAMPCGNFWTIWYRQEEPEHFFFPISIIPPVSQIKVAFTFPQTYTVFPLSLNKTILPFSVQDHSICSFNCMQ